MTACQMPNATLQCMVGISTFSCILCVYANAARSGHCTEGLVLELPKQQLCSKAANSWLGEGTGAWA